VSKRFQDVLDPRRLMGKIGPLMDGLVRTGTLFSSECSISGGSNASFPFGLRKTQPLPERWWIPPERWFPNAAITLTNVATGQVRQTTSNNSGIYTFANVGVGHFNLDATAPGFEKFSRTDIV
jgi:hypothetical protein